MQSQLGLNKIEFQSIPSQYRLGESVYCYFVVPGSVQQGDCIGLVPVGWKNVSDVICKKLVSLENIWGTVGPKFGHVLFESHVLPVDIQGNQMYQFVFVRNGSLVHGISRPFTFVPTCGGGQLTGLRSYGIQQWINRLKQTVGGVYGGVYGGLYGGLYGGEGVYTEQPYYIQYQQGLKFLHKGLEQVLLNEFEGVLCMQQGIEYIQKYLTLSTGLPQEFHMEIQKILLGVQELEQLFIKYRKTETVVELPPIYESVIFKQQVLIVKKGLQLLRTIVPVPVSVFVQEPTTLISKIKELFVSLPIDSTWGQQAWEEFVHTVGKFLIEQEKVESIQRQLEQERIVCQLRTIWLCNVLFSQQVDTVMRMKLKTLLKEVMQHVYILRQKEQIHLSTVGQKMALLMTQFESRTVFDLPRFREMCLELVCGQVSSHITLRACYKDLTCLLDEIEVHFGEYPCVEQCVRRPGQQLEQILSTPTVEYKWIGGEQIPVEKFGLGTELYTPYGTTATLLGGIYPTIHQLKINIQKLKYGGLYESGVFGGVEQLGEEFLPESVLISKILSRKDKQIITGVVPQCGLTYPLGF